MHKFHNTSSNLKDCQNRRILFAGENEIPSSEGIKCRETSGGKTNIR